MKFRFSSKLFISIFVISLLAVMLSASVIAQEATPVEKVVLLSNVQAADPIEFESARLIAENMRQLGLEVEHEAIPWEQYSTRVWFERDNWQMTAWRMVARPERMDPDEFVFNLFHSSTAEAGYNFVGYDNPEYDALAEAQRSELDTDARRDIIFQAQEIIANDVPYVYVAHPALPQLIRTDVFDTNSIVDAQGIGVQNFWTWIGLNPLGDQASIITNTGDVVQAINPLYISGDADSRVTELVWDRLLRIGPDGLPQPWAAESVDWEDNVNIVITIRNDMAWHDGNPVTIEDVKFSFEAPQTGESPQYAPFVSRVENIEIIDDTSLRITLNEPWAAFETAALAKLNIIPQHIWESTLADLPDSEDNAEDIQEEIPVGSGPFRVVGYDLAESIILEANPDHFSAPNASQWILRIIPNQESSLGQMQTGELNFLREWEGDSEILAEVAESDPNLELFASPDLGFRFFAFNERLEPFDDANLRRAVAHVVPQQAIVDNIFKGFAVTADSYVSTAIDFWHNPNLPQYEFNVEQARQILADASYTWDDEGRLLNPVE